MQPLTQIRAGTEAMYTHFPHVTPGSFTIDMYIIVSAKDNCHPAVPVFGMFCVNLVNNSLDPILFITDRNRLVVKACAVNAQKLCLLTYTEFLVIPINHIHAVITGFRAGQIFF